MQVKSNLDFWVEQALHLFDEMPWLSWGEVLQTLAETYETREVYAKATRRAIIERVNDVRGE